MLRPTPLRRYLSVMRERGFAPEPLLAGTGLTASVLDDAQALIETSQYQQIVANMLALSGGEGLGLDVGLQRDVKDFGILGYAAQSCRSIRHSVEEFWGGRGGYGDALGMMARIVVPRSRGEVTTVDIIAPGASTALHRFFVEEALCLLLKVGAQVSGVPPRFLGLEFAYPRPRYVARYEALFQCPLRFAAPRTRASFDRAWFESPLQSSDPELTALYAQRLRQMREQIVHSQPLAARLNSLFRQHAQVPALDVAARELGLSARTLRRQLQQQQLSYRQLAIAFRQARVLERIQTGSAAAKQISEAAGFGDVNAFRRAFKKWTGMTLKQYRARSA